MGFVIGFVVGLAVFPTWIRGVRDSVVRRAEAPMIGRIVTSILVWAARRAMRRAWRAANRGGFKSHHCSAYNRALDRYRAAAGIDWERELLVNRKGSAR